MTTTPPNLPRFSELRLMRLPGPGRLWKLTRPLTWGEWTVPVGFISDGNSWVLKHPASEAAGWLHDYFYRESEFLVILGRNRAWADRMFYRALLSEGVHPIVARAQWLAVRALGWRYWRKLPVTLAAED